MVKDAAVKLMVRIIDVHCTNQASVQIDRCLRLQHVLVQVCSIYRIQPLRSEKMVPGSYVNNISY